MNKTSTASSNIIHFTARIGILADAILMAAGLLFFILWFGWNMNHYLGSIEANGIGTSAIRVSGGGVPNLPANLIAENNG
jgi:hypothetical protein